MKKEILFLCSVLVLFSIHSCRKENPDLIVKDELNGDGTFVYDGRTYTYKRIMGEVAWMIENLAYLPSVSPSSAISKTTPTYYVYGYEGSSVIAAKATENYKKYGVLYNLEAAKTACPPGWHLPSDREWRMLLYYAFGVDLDFFNNPWLYGWVNGDAMARYLKSTTGWLGNGYGDNSIGFTAIPAGALIPGNGFRGLGYSADFWTSTTDPLNWGWRWALFNDNDVLFHTIEQPNLGYSVRCIEDWE